MSTEIKNLFEFQAKGNHAPEFTGTDIFKTKAIRVFNDGQRLICSVLEERSLMGQTFYDVQDVDGCTATISAKHFHKITEPKNFSKKFIMLKQKYHIVDKI